MKKQPTPASLATARLLTLKAAAQYLSVHIWFLRTQVWERRIPFLKLGNRLLFDIKDLDNFVEVQKTAVRP